MKKITAVLLSALLLISCSACEFLFREGIPEDDAPPPTENASPADVISPSTEPPYTEPDIIPSASPEPDSPVPEDSTDPEDTADDTMELTVYVGGASQTAEAAPYTAELRDDISFKMFYDDAAYDVAFKNNAYVFTPLSENASELDYLEISFISGADSETILPSFADSYINFTDIEFSSYTPVGKARLSAESIIAYNSEQYLNAYLIDAANGVITIVISSDSQYSANFAWFKAMLDTFEA